VNAPCKNFQAEERRKKKGGGGKERLRKNAGRGGKLDNMGEKTKRSFRGGGECETGEGEVWPHGNRAEANSKRVGRSKRGT